MNEKLNSVRCLSGSTLKLIAIITMFIDHLGASVVLYGILMQTPPSFVPEWNWYLIYQIMRDIGRMAFPIFCFLLVEGFYHTSNRKKYAIRLAIFALISELPFDLALIGTTWSAPLELGYQNVYFTLCIGLLTIWAMDAVHQKNLHYMADRICTLLIWIAGGALAWLLRTDYDWKGILIIGVFYLCYQQPLRRTILGICSVIWEPFAIIAFLPINLYNGKRGFSLKYFFYFFYPAHLLLLAVLLHMVFQA